MFENKKMVSTFLAIILFLFGLVTVMAGGKALFTTEGIEARGNAVPLVLWFNFIAGFFYILAGVSTFRLKACVQKLALVIASANFLVLIYLAVHIFTGGLYEVRTLMAMSFRTIFWVVVALYLLKSKLLKQNYCQC